LNTEVVHFCSIFLAFAPVIRLAAWEDRLRNNRMSSGMLNVIGYSNHIRLFTISSVRRKIN